MRKMVSIALSPEERDRDSPMMLGRGPDDGGECYSCASFHLDDATLKKLDLDDEGVERGDTLHAFVLAKVTGVTDMEHGKCIYLQITDIGIEDEDKEEAPEASDDRASKRYASADAEEGEYD